MKRALCALLLCATATGCAATYERGRFAAVSTTSVGVPRTIIQRDAEGRSCAQLLAQSYQAALADALAKHPGANALIDLSYSFEELCIVVRGTAVHVP